MSVCIILCWRLLLSFGIPLLHCLYVGYNSPIGPKNPFAVIYEWVADCLNIVTDSNQKRIIVGSTNLNLLSEFVLECHFNAVFCAGVWLVRYRASEYNLKNIFNLNFVRSTQTYEIGILIFLRTETLLFMP